MHNPPIQDEPKGPGFFERLCKRLVFIVLGSVAVAGILHLYRLGQLPLIQQPLPGFDHALFSTPAPTEPSASAPSGAPSTSAATPGPGGKPPVVWTRQDLADMSLEAPFTLKTAPPSKQYLNDFQLQQIVERFSWAGKSADNFEIVIDFVRINGSHTYSLEDEVRGIIRRLTEASSDPAPSYRRTDVFVDGVPGRYLSYAYAVNGVKRHYEVLFLQNVRDAMVVAIVYLGEAHTADAQRVLASVHVRR